MTEKPPISPLQINRLECCFLATRQLDSFAILCYNGSIKSERL